MTRVKRTRGQAMVEFALVLPVFMLLTLGVVDFARAIWTSNTIAFVARDGARYGSIPSHSTADIQSYVRSRCLAMVSDTCSVTPPALPGASAISVTRGECGNPSSPVVVSVSYEFEAVTMMLANVWGGGTLPLEATSRMYVEAGPSGGCAP